MAVITIPRTPWIDDDGSGQTGTVLNNAVKTHLYNEIDVALAQVAGPRTLFVPTLTAGGNTIGPTYGTRTASYTRAGNLFHIQIGFTLTALGAPGSGPLAVTGFPFVPNNTGAAVMVGPPAYISGFGAQAPSWTWIALAAYEGNPVLQINGMRSTNSDIGAPTFASLVAPVAFYANITITT